MKSILKVYLSDLQAIVTNPATLVIVIGLIILPSMYAWFNIGALIDPYGNAKDLPIGVISLDQGITVDDQVVNVGQEVIADLQTNHELAWQFPATEEQLLDKVNTGEYYAAIIIPNNFSQQLKSAVDTYQSPSIDYLVNEKVNAIAPKMTEAGAEGITAEINSSINQVVTANIVDYSNQVDQQVQAKTDDYYLALDSLNTVINQFDQIDQAFIEYDQLTDEVDQGIATIDQFNHQVETQVNQLNYDNLYTTIDQLATEIDDPSQVEALRTEVSQVEQFTNEFELTVDTSQYTSIDNQIADFIYNQWPGYQTQIVNSRNQLIEVGDDYQKIAEYLQKDGDQASDFMANPVNLETETLYPVANYGSASTPFYTALCLWVGSLLLVSMLSFETKLTVSNRVEYCGKLLLFITIGILQALVVTLGNVTILDITITSPLMMLIFNLIIVTVFITIVYSLVYVFGNIGKAIGIIILVLSISGGGGNFPIEVSGPFFNHIYQYLPFTYGVKLLREAVAGIYWPTVVNCLQNLGLMLVISLGFGFLGTRYLKPTFDRFDRRARESKIIH